MLVIHGRLVLVSTRGLCVRLLIAKFICTGLYNLGKPIGKFPNGGRNAISQLYDFQITLNCLKLVFISISCN